MKCIAVAFAILLTGCATLAPNQAQLTFISDPPGAMLYEGKTPLGMAPQVRIYTVQEGHSSTTNPITAVWGSGAQASMRFNLALRRRQNATLYRPPNAPGLDKDLMIAIQLQQGETARKVANDAALGNALRIMKPQQTLTTTCLPLGNGMISCSTN